MKALFLLPLMALVWLSCNNSHPDSMDAGETNSLATKTNPLLGTWKVVSTLNLTTLQKEEESRNYFHVFSEDYHMILMTPENRPKVYKNWEAMTHEEMKGQLPIHGGLLKYEIRGQAMYSYYVSAVTEDFKGKRVIDEFEFRGDTLVHRNDHYSDGQMREWKLVRMDRE